MYRSIYSISLNSLRYIKKYNNKLYPCIRLLSINTNHTNHINNINEYIQVNNHINNHIKIENKIETISSQSNNNNIDWQKSWFTFYTHIINETITDIHFQNIIEILISHLILEYNNNYKNTLLISYIEYLLSSSLDILLQNSKSKYTFHCLDIINHFIINYTNQEIQLKFWNDYNMVISILLYIVSIILKLYFVLLLLNFFYIYFISFISFIF
jgi:hypothetical protein